jgi:hypothetical protein
MFRLFAQHEVRYVLIGMLGATLHGSNLRTGDADICPAADAQNLGRLAAALQQMEPRIRGQIDALDPLGETLFPCEPERLARVRGSLLLSTRYGDLDLVFRPDGTAGYDDLARHAVQYDIGEGLLVPVASLEDILRSKTAADRPKDREALPTLRALIERRRG